MLIEDFINQTLKDQFAPAHLKVVNESHKHKGHMGDDGSGQTHFKVEIEASVLKPLSRVDAQRKIYEVLDPAFQNGLHALALKIIR